MSKYTREEILQHRAEWVAALRSGKYPQTKGRLRRAGGYCCLGVACEVAGVKPLLRAGVYLYGSTQSCLEMPPEVREWLGVTKGEPTSTLSNDKGDPMHYTELNDAEGYTFEQIADHFERYGFHPSIDVLAQEETESD